MNFPHQVFKDLFFECSDGQGDARLARLMNILGPKVYITSDYSGIRCWEQAWEALVKEAIKVRPRDDHPLIYHRSCDNDMAVQKVLLSWPHEKSAPRHIFRDINEYVPKHYRDQLDAMHTKAENAPAGKTREARAEMHREMELFLYKNREEIFAEASLAWCMRGRLMSRITPNILQPIVRDGVERHAPLMVNGAGSTCCGWSSRNTAGQKGVAHAAKRPFTIWKCQRSVVKDDLWFHENARNFPPEELYPPEEYRHCMKHEVLSVTVGPEDLGWPVSRKRKLSVGYNPEKLIWMGPDQDSIQRDFMIKFHRGRSCTGDIFFKDSADHIYDEFRQAARKRGFTLSNDTDWGTFDPASLLSPGAKRRKAEHEAAIRKFSAGGS